MRFSDTFLNELTARNEISDVVGGYVRLSKRSGANQFGLCPFHNEKTGSFSVNTDRQTYHCFGCGKGGGVISFIMEIENLEFPAAVEFLAKRAGMQMPEQEFDPQAKKRARLLELNKEAARYYYEQLHLPSGKPAVDYMIRRQISPAIAKSFGLGYAPDDWHGLHHAMLSKGFTNQEMAEVGLIKKGQKGNFYDGFRNRLMFPVIDVRGNVIGFSGRIIGDGEPKYINSPESVVYTKGRNLFALNLAKKSKAGYLILSEGNIDIVSLHQAGFDNAVASLGTALTPEQARLISQYTNEVVIAYDNDGAGMKAAQKAINIFSNLDVKVKVLRMTGAKDPDEFIKAKGADAFRALIQDSENHIEYQLMTVRQKYDLAVPEQKADFAKESAKLIAKLPSPVTREVYSGRVAEMCQLRPEIIQSEVAQARKQLMSSARKNETKAETDPSRTLAGSVGSRIRFSDPASAAAEEGILRLLMQDSVLIRHPDLPPAEMFTCEAYQHIYSAICTRLKDGGTATSANLASDLTSEEMSILIALIEKPEILSNSEQTMSDYCKRVRDLHQQKSPEQSLKDIYAQYKVEKA